MDAPEALREFLAYVVANLIDHPRQASIASGRNASGTLVFRVMLDPDDMRRVHGRNGMTASAIRSLLSTAAEKHGLRVSLKISANKEQDDSAEPGEGAPPADGDPDTNGGED
ncbi:MAG TPA: KH domain-containing protein [Verrucomicrobiales bacterium]|nr:KH domain-containing protein [Verrucomicrobiales bacterium]HRJ08135.1 KH domain-containing protein [Prosthecobacter sp.]HRK13792.1 KH domain-containing protein [Prosthecobacter sp.]